MARTDRLAPKRGKSINRAPKVSSRYSVTPRRMPKDMHNVFIAQAKIMRLLELIMFLQASRWTIEQLAEKFDMSDRTIYRYIQILESLEFGVEKDFDNRYFIVEDTCPLCGGELRHD